MRRINIVWMRRSEIAGELVQCVVTDESAGLHDGRVSAACAVNKALKVKRIG